MSLLEMTRSVLLLGLVLPLAGCEPSPVPGEATPAAETAPSSPAAAPEHGAEPAPVFPSDAAEAEVPAPSRDGEPGALAPGDDAEPEPPPPEATPGPTFTVIARLIDAGRSVPHCGVIHFKVVMKLEVLRVIDGVFEGSTLYAGVSCPEMPPTRTRGFRWTVGDTFEVRLRSAGLRRGGALVDAFEGEAGKRYELLHIEPVAPPAE